MNSKILLTALALATPGSLLLADGGRLNHSGAVKNGQGSDPDWDDFWVTEQTVEDNQALYEIREQIAATAVWDGIGPGDVSRMMGAGGDWHDLALEHKRLTGDRKVRAGRTKVLSRNSAAGTDQMGPMPDGGYDDGRSLARAELWPGGVIPYTFSDFMIDSFFGREDGPEAINAAAGVANAFAVMILIEQDTPLIFVPFDPALHSVGGFLLWDNTGDGENPPPIEDLDDPDTSNFVNRIGVSPQPGSLAIPPTTLNHGFWQNFPSMIRSMGFVLGLDWEQRHPDRDRKLDVRFENIPPAFAPDGSAWARPGPNPPIGAPGAPPSPGFPGTGFGDDSGADLFIIQQDDPSIFPVDCGCDCDGDGDVDADDESVDLSSMMLIDEMGYNNVLPMYFIRDAYRYVDLDGMDTDNDGDLVDDFPGSPDDLMTAPEPVYFSTCDLAAIDLLYEISGDLCPADLDGNGIVDPNDIAIFFGWYNSQDPQADLNQDGVITVADLVEFFVQLAQSTDCDRNPGIAGDNNLQSIS